MKLIEKEWLEDLLLAHEQNARSIEASGRKVSFTYADGIRTAYADVGLCPAVDAVIVVRCKDCKYRFVDGENVRFNVCELNHNKVQSDDWFCADGERRIDE